MTSPKNLRQRRIGARLRQLLLAAGAGVTVICTGCAHGPPPLEGSMTSSGKAFAPTARELGIERAAKLGPGVYRGAQPTSGDLVTLKNQGFRTVVNLRSAHSERRQVEALGMKAVEIPMRADLTCTPPTEAQVFQFLDTVLNPANQPVFVHCAHGCDRTGVMAAIYRMEVDGWEPAEAIEEMRAFGCSSVYGDLFRYVENYRRTGIYASRMKTPPLEARAR